MVPKLKFLKLNKTCIASFKTLKAIQSFKSLSLVKVL